MITTKDSLMHYIPKVFQKLARNIYYRIFHGRVIQMQGDNAARGKYWIINKRYDRAYYKGYYERRLTNYISNFLSSDSVFVDAGSHAGYFSLIAASKASNGEIFSFEPDGNNYNYIKSVKEINGISHWRVENKGLGEEAGELKFRRGPTSSMGKIAEDGEMVVPVVSMDMYFEKEPPPRIDLMKIDVEGYGGKVLKGAIQTITRFRPTILFEVHEGSDELSTAWSLLKDQYNFIDVSNSKVIELNPDSHIHFLLLEPKSQA